MAFAESWRVGFELELILGDLNDPRFEYFNSDPMDVASHEYCRAVAADLTRFTGKRWLAAQKKQRRTGYFVYPEYDLDPLDWPEGTVAGVELVTPPLSIAEADDLRRMIAEWVYEVDGDINSYPNRFSLGSGWHINIDPGEDSRRFDEPKILLGADELPPCWALVGRIISGPGQFDRLQDEYARAMEPLGLCRGEVKSGRKHKPVRGYLAELRAQEVANAKQAADLQAELARLRDRALRTEVDRRVAHKDRQAAASAKAAWEQARAKVEAERLAVEEDRRLIGRLFDALGHTNRVATKFMQMVKRFPESRWSEETLMMAEAASAAAGPSLDAVGRLRDYMALTQGRGR
ncbi:hypothetical protein BV95_02715 [Sphingobium chlorophenolicum]|uniref:Uncharacterized protein n=2 Tax=Sphingobium chlorophenolicum TaxID=46429 RepID=A0A081RCY6_SPHCR|nr:hypothetical protein BV95_02715 [Sphingobium chlorophenolicum]